MTKLLTAGTLLCLLLPLSIAGCDGESPVDILIKADTGPKQTVGLGDAPKQSVGLDAYRAKQTQTAQPGENSENGADDDDREAPAPTAAVAPEQTKTYTFQGNVLLPPDVYMNSVNNNVEAVDVCGVLSPAQPDAQKYCFKFSELYNRLYDANHSGLDVWEVRRTATPATATQPAAQSDWLLLLTKADSAAQQKELWVMKSQFGIYHPYANIMQQKLLFLGDWNYQTQPAWPLQAYDGPGGNVIELKKENYPTNKSPNPMIVITSVAQSPQNELWFRLNLINSLCGQPAPPNTLVSPVVMNLWYPAYRVENNLRVPTVWYNAKGC